MPNYAAQTNPVQLVQVTSFGTSSHRSLSSPQLPFQRRNPALAISFFFITLPTEHLNITRLSASTLGLGNNVILGERTD